MAARVTQSAIELLTLQNPAARVTQSVIEFVVGLGITCDNPPGGQVGNPYSHTFPAGSGDPPYTFAIIAGALPDGLALNAATGVVSGIPTRPNTFVFTIQVTDTFGAQASVQCSIVILGAMLIALYGWKRFRRRDACGPLEELPPVKPVKRVM